MFNKDMENRIKEIENRLSARHSSFYASDFNYDRILDYLERINARITANATIAEKQIQDIKDFLELEEHKPDCTPYLRKKRINNE